MVQNWLKLCLNSLYFFAHSAQFRTAQSSGLEMVVVVVVIVIVMFITSLIMIVAFTRVGGISSEIVVGSALAVMSFSAPRGRISSMEGAPYQGLDSLQSTNSKPAHSPTDQWQSRAVIWSIQPNCVSFDAYFYDNDFPNMSDVVWAGSDLTVDLSSPIYFIPHRTDCCAGSASKYWGMYMVTIMHWPMNWIGNRFFLTKCEQNVNIDGQWASIMVGCCTCREANE